MRRFCLLVATLLMIGAAPALAVGNGSTYIAHLEGDNEIPAVDSQGRGQVILEVERGGEAISYKLIASNIDDVVQAHIHLGGPDVNGPVVAFLFGPVTGVDNNGVLSRGTITASDLVGPLAGASLDDLLAEMKSGDAYVNVHTIANPGGEIRGQIR
ncbi:MAG TPA: CHRD domain-containing protein [Acidimicrobiia bacterium]|nr:CHRD domain-containing protein [Acidimicrobiia bacterium]